MLCEKCGNEIKEIRILTTEFQLGKCTNGNCGALCTIRFVVLEEPKVVSKNSVKKKKGGKRNGKLPNHSKSEPRVTTLPEV